MTRTETIIGVLDVERSSTWYQQLLNCKGKHGGPVFEILADQDDTVLLCLHQWGEHEHPSLTSPQVTPGNGLILYFRVDKLDGIWKNAQALNPEVEYPPRLNQNSGKREFSLRDLDGYYVSVSE